MVTFHPCLTAGSIPHSYFFPCQRWLATNKDDGQISRELVPVDAALKRKLTRQDSSTAIRDQIGLETKGKQLEPGVESSLLPPFLSHPSYCLWFDWFDALFFFILVCLMLPAFSSSSSV